MNGVTRGGRGRRWPAAWALAALVIAVTLAIVGSGRGVPQRPPVDRHGPGRAAVPATAGVPSERGTVATPVASVEDVDGSGMVEGGGPVLAGVVLDPDGRPAVGASVVMRDAARVGAILASAPTDAAGAFAFHAGDLDGGEGFPECVMLGAEGAGGAGVSAQVTWPCGAAAPRENPVLRLRRGAVVRARILDESGHPVAGGELLVWHHAGWKTPWNGLEGWGLFRGEADAEGRVALSLPPGDYRAHARAPGGLLAAARTGEIRGVELVDLGDLRVAGGEVRVTVSVRDANGTPVPGAVVRLPADDAAQRHLCSPAHEGYHLRTAEDGRVAFSVEARAEPLLLGVGGDAHEVAETRVEREEPGHRHVEVVLRRRPRARIRFETAAGLPLPDAITPWIRATPDPSDAWSSHHGDGSPDAAAESAGRGGPPTPAEALRDVYLSSPSPRRTRHPGEFEVFVRRTGRIHVTARLGPGPAVEGWAAAGVEDTVEATVLRIAEGRAVRLLVDAAEDARDVPGNWKIWGGARGEFGDAFPATAEEARAASSTAYEVALLRGRRRRADVFLWLPAQMVELFARDTLSLAIEPGERSGPHAERALRWGEPPTRLAVPEAPHPTVSLVVRRRPPPVGARRIAVRLVAEGAPLRVAGWHVGFVRGSGLEGVEMTDAEGVAVLHAVPGRHLVDVGLDRAPPRPTPMDVPAADADGPLEVAVDLAGRAWR